MTIRRGEPWGSEVGRPADLLVVGSDADVAAAFSDAPARPVGVSGGDLHRSLGAPIARADAQRLPLDVLRVSADGVDHVAVAHVVARRSWWRGRIVGAFNVDHLGPWNVAPRAHPNDGRMDVIEVDGAMPLRQRWQARARLPAGTHVPHPMISTRTASETSWSFDRPHGLWLDGRRVGDVSSLRVAVEPDAFAVIV